jgi:hypothetical protein
MSFSTAALARLVESCTDEPLHGAGSDALEVLTVLDRLVHTEVLIGFQAGFEHFDVASQALWGPAVAQRVLAIAGLIELGLTAGYLDFPADEGPVFSSILGGPFAAFQAETLAKADETAMAASLEGVRLFERLMKRIATGDLSATHHDRHLFDVFESYVNLTSYVWSDSAFHQFLIDTHSESASWILDDDRAFLVTPRHFAAAVATGSIGGKRAAAPNGGLAALRYFDWLAEIVAAAGDSPLADDIIRHARWAHSLDRAETRLHLWASAMAEWPAGERDVEGEQVWAEYVSRVFASLGLRQAALGIPAIPPKIYVGESSPGPIGTEPALTEVLQQVENLKAQGRTGAARRVAADAAATLYASLATDDDEWPSRADLLVDVCTVISDLGGADVAAAYVAPIRARAERLGRAFSFLAAADAVLLAARNVVAPPPDQTAAVTGTTNLSAEYRNTARPSARRLTAD